MEALDRTTNLVMLIVIITLGVAASACAVTAAYVYLRSRADRHAAARDRLARRWLIATAVLGFTVIGLRFVWFLIA
jgi:heme/copper-type cytochrome/quinol oxidase subunit 3